MKDNDLIRRGDAFTLFQKQYIDTQEGTDHVAIRINIGVTKCIHAMQDIPAVDAVEVRHGHWTKMLDRKFINTNRHEEQLQKEVLGYGGRVIENLRCSVCRKVTMVDNSILYSFCPHCGARMDGRREDGDA